MGITYDLDGRATVILVPPRTVSPALSLGGDNMPFDSLRAAVTFVMEQMSENDRAAASINTEDGPLKDVKQFEKLYRIIALENDEP